MQNRELPFIREMFDSIAPRYDLLNRLLSLRRDVVWRRKMVSAIPDPGSGPVLDVACGTGDVTMEIYRQKGRGVKVVGMDFSPAMLSIASGKRSRTGAAGCSLVAGNALALPFQAETFRALTIAFGIRNIQDKPGALEAFHRVLAPGGTLLVLELTTPARSALRDAYLAYFQKLLPLVGRLFSKHRFAYSYLPESVARFPTADRFMHQMRGAGFEHVRCGRLTMGIASLFIGRRPR